MANVNVLDEDSTLDLVLAGKSITRFGDGEFKVANGGSIKSQEADESLARRLRQILQNDKDYLVGIPRYIPGTEKNTYWRDFMQRPYVKQVLPEGGKFASALITRPDSAPHINRPEYYKKITQVWQNKVVAFVWGGSSKSLRPEHLKDAEFLHVVQSLPRHAWKDRDRLLGVIRGLDPKPEVCVLTLGPTATAIVPDIHAMGIQAVDLGHIGMWLRRIMSEKKGFTPRHGFFWPRGAEEYGKRYIDRAPDMDTAISLCKDRRSVIQAGGHVGVWPKYLAERFKRVYTFEPEMLNFLALCKNCPETNIYRYQAALGFNREPISITVHPANIGGNHVSGGGRIPCFRIDDMNLKDVDLIVLDIEGSELDALKGAQHTLQACKPVLHLELRGHIEKYKRGKTEDVYDLLKKLGYKKHADIHKDQVWVHPEARKEGD